RCGTTAAAPVRIGGAIATEGPAREPYPATRDAVQDTVDDDVTGRHRRRGAREQEVDARTGDGGVGGRERDLLTDDRRQIRIEREHERLDVVRLLGRQAEHRRAEEARDRIDAAVVQEAESAHLLTHEGALGRADRRDRRHAEHPDLLVRVAQMRDLEVLRLAIERAVAIRSEEAYRSLEDVAPV